MDSVFILIKLRVFLQNLRPYLFVAVGSRSDGRYFPAYVALSLARWGVTPSPSNGSNFPITHVMCSIVTDLHHWSLRVSDEDAVLILLWENYTSNIM